MGSQRMKDMRAGIVRPGPQDRLPFVSAGEIEKARLQSQNERQARCRALRKERQVAAELEFLANTPADDLEDREKRRIASNMYFACTEELSKCPGPLTRKDVLGKLIDKFHTELPDHILSKKRSFAQQEVMSGFQQALSEVRGSNSGPKLATRHALLTAAVSATNISSIRQVAIALDVHPRNIRQAMVRRRLMCESGGFLWNLSVRRKRMDGMTAETKNAVLTWWVSESRVSPNKKDVTRKRIGPGVYDEKPTHYLLETQVKTKLIFLILSCSIE